MKAYDLSKSRSRASKCKWNCNIEPNTLCTPEQLSCSSPEYFFHDVLYRQERSDLRTVPAQVTTWGLKRLYSHSETVVAFGEIPPC